MLLAGLLLACLLFYPRARAVFSDPDPRSTPDQDPAERVAPATKTCDINILLLGVDERDGDTGRSDTLMLLHYNALRNTLHLMSIPRDTRVRLPQYGYQKVNAAYPYGGPELVKEAVGGLTGLHIDYFVRVDFDGFTKIVDAMGGVYIEVESQMDYDDPYQDLHIHLSPGVQRLKGKESLDYVRWRGDARADLGRVERQREFLGAVMRRMISPGAIIRMPKILLALGRAAKTDIPVLMRPGLAFSVTSAYVKGIETSTMPGYTATIGDVSYFVADEEETSTLISSWSLPRAKRESPGT